jgi:hypothetical protein
MKSSNNTDKMSNQNKDRYKSYLIEKLLNENKTNIQQQQQQQQQTNGLNDSQEDLTSETGTYVIEDDLNNNNNNGGQQSTQPPPSVTLSSIDLKQSTNTIDLMSARAAIDETFGVNQQSTPKRQTQKVIRARNQTYSLTKDLFLSSDKESILTNTNNNEEIEVEQEQEPAPQSILKKTITYDIIPNHIQDDMNESTVSNVSSKVIGTDILLGDTNQLMEQIKLKRYEKRQSIKARIISANNSLLNQSRSSSSSCSSSLTINNQHDDSIQDTNNQPIKSWTIPCDQEDNVPYDENYFNSSRATVDASQDHSIILTNQMKNQSRTNGGMAFEFILDVNNNTSLTNKKNTNHDDNESNLLTNSITSFNSTRRIKPKSDESIMSSSTYSTLTTSTNNNNLATPKSNTTAMSLGAKIQAKAKENINANCNNNNTSENLDKLKQRNLMRRISSDSSSLQFNNNNNNNGSSATPTPPQPPPSQYMNRTLMLRQQTAKARRNSDNKTDFDSPSLNGINNKTNQVISKQSSTLNSVLKKLTTPTTTTTTSNSSSSSKTSGNTKSYLNLSNIQTNNSTTVKKNTSRSNSREAINRIQNSSLMTTSLTLPSSQNEQRDALLRRKLYDPVKAVKLDQMKKEEKRKSLLLQEQQQQQQQQIIEDNDNSFSTKSLNYSIDENSVSDTLNSFPLQNFNNQTNINRQVNKIIIFLIL